MAKKRPYKLLFAFFTIGYLIAIMPGCVYKKVSPDIMESIEFDEALYYDIPLMLNAECDNVTNYAEAQTSFSYLISGELQEIVNFYREEMERMGWQFINQFNGAETLVIFEKPRSRCAVSIRSLSANRHKIIIFIQR